MKKILLILLFFCSLFIYSNENTQWKFSFAFELPVLNTDFYNDAAKVNFSPNNSLINKFGIQYKNIGMFYGFSSGEADSDYDVSTRSNDFQGFFYFSTFGFDLYFQNYKGFYIANIPINDTILFPNMKMETLTINGYFKIFGNEDISAFSDPIKEKRLISFLWFGLGSLSHRKIESEKDIIPREKIDLVYFQDINKFECYIPSLSNGILLSMHFYKFYFNPCLSIGFGIPLSNTDIKIKPEYSIKVNLKGSIGFEGNRVGLGMDVANDSDAIIFKNTNKIQFHSILVSIKLFVKL